MYKLNDDNDDDERARKVEKKALNLLHKYLARPLLISSHWGKKKEKTTSFWANSRGSDFSLSLSLDRRRIQKTFVSWYN